jgi:Carboxypeptidase regulatory-like domain
LVLMLSAWLLFSGSATSYCQDQQPPAPTPGQPTTVRGVVRNVASGEPLARALVRIEGDASTGVLTDGDGRFEIPDLPSGPQMFEVIKPGYLDAAAGVGTSEQFGNPHDYAHNVIVIDNMPELIFKMTPVNSIRGQIQLSSGDPAEGISVMLLRRSVQDGRAVWQISGTAKTNSEGTYRFGELPDGLYEIYTTPTMDSEAATNLVESGSGKTVAREGYASVFYPDARDLATAAKIRLAGGQQAQANIALALEPFQSVTAAVRMPRTSSGGDNVTIQVLDAQGHQLPYDTQYDAQTHTAQAMVPDGTYRMFAAMMSTRVDPLSSQRAGENGLVSLDARIVTGEVTFAVAGHAVSNLLLPMSTMRSSPIQVTVRRGANGAVQTDNPRLFVTLSQTGGWMTDGMVNNFAEGTVDGPLEGAPPAPGSYWVHTGVASRTLCEASFTEGGTDLAQEPLVLGGSGASAPLFLTLRDDCAKLTLTLPASVGIAPGEEIFYIVYVVPDAGTTADIEPQTLRPSSGGRITLTGLTPGNYHVYAFDHPVALEYRNPAALAALQSQTVALTPGAETELTVEAHQP